MTILFKTEKDKLIHDLQAVIKDTEDFVKVNPWKSVGIAAGVGLVVGLLVGRR